MPADLSREGGDLGASSAAGELGDIRQKLEEIRRTLRALGASAAQGPIENGARASIQSARDPFASAVRAPRSSGAPSEDGPAGGEVSRLVDRIRTRNALREDSRVPIASGTRNQPQKFWPDDGLADAIREIEARQAALDADTSGARRPSDKSAAGAVAPDRTLPDRDRAEDRRDRAAGSVPEPKRLASSEQAVQSLSDQVRRIEALVSESPTPAQIRSLDDYVRQLGNRIEEIASSTPSPAAFAALERGVADIARLLAEGFPPGGISALQDQLVEVGGRVRRLEELSADTEALDQLEKQIARIEEMIRHDGRHAQFAGLQRQVEGIEREIRSFDSRFTELATSAADRASVGQLAERIEDIAKRLELQSGPQVTDLLESLEARLDSLGLLLESSALSSGDRDVFRQIAGRMGTLESRLDRIDTIVPSLGSLATVDSRLDEISRAIAARPTEVGSAISRLENQLVEIARHVDTLGENARNPAALEELEAQIARLASQLEASDGRFASLDALEQLVEDLLSSISGSREDVARIAREAAEQAVLEARSALGSDSQTDVAIDALRESLQELHRATQASEKRRLDVLGSLQDSLSRIVERMAALEAEVAGSAKTREEHDALARALPARPMREDPRPAPLVRGDASRERDRPLEPGTGRPAVLHLGEPESDEEPDGSERTETEPESTRVDFISAARRAVRQAAAFEPPVAPAAQPAAGDPADAELDNARRVSRLKSLLQNKRRSIALATAAALLAAGAVQFQGLVGVDGTPGAVESKGVSLAKTSPLDRLPNSPTAGAMNARDPKVAAGRSDASSLDGEARLQIAPKLTPPATALAFATPGLPPERFEAEPAVHRTASPASDDAEVPPPQEQRAAIPVPDAAVGSEVLRQAAVQGDPRAQYEIAVRYTEGKVVQRDLSAAATWYELAAQQGLAPAQYRLGNLLEKGLGRERDLAAAKTWYERAAAAGNRMAMHNLGVLSAEGADGSPDYANARKWFERAAELGVKDSQFNLGVIYGRGLGTPQDLVESYKWFTAASATGDMEAARKRDEVLARMPAQQRELAADVAQAYRPKVAKAEANEVRTPDGGWDAEVAKPLPSTSSAATNLQSQRLLTQQVQVMLSQRGYDPGPSDGVPGRKTRDAIRAFERSVGLPETGQVTPDLFRKLTTAT